MALHSLYCADVPLRNSSLTHSLAYIFHVFFKSKDHDFHAFELLHMFSRSLQYGSDCSGKRSVCSSNVSHCRQRWKCRTRPACTARSRAGSRGGHVTKCPRGHVARRHYKFNQDRAAAGIPRSRLIVYRLQSGPKKR